ncbi:hypothetical protein CRG98_012537 [Punica granatum]|uniref:Uncharacterized protein n=1 Tax=Punica granatum TaxID=22663 RepID=A0A2I0KFV6_PUNGR|nr:hypothetical protein CRG98_012537 [Punica granatum]
MYIWRSSLGKLDAGVTSEEHKRPFSVKIHIRRSSLGKLDAGVTSEEHKRPFSVKIHIRRSIPSFRVKDVLSSEQCTRSRTLPHAHEFAHTRRAPNASRARPVHSSRTPRAPSSPNVHALALEHPSKRSTESPDSRTLP